MQPTRLKLILLVLGLSIVQTIINNMTSLYIDSLSVVLIMLLLCEDYSWRDIILLALFADLIGRWYLGSHLLAVVLISFLMQKLITFYHVSVFFQRVVMVSLFYLLIALILALIGLIMHNVAVNWIALIIEVLLVAPSVMCLFSLLQNNNKSAHGYLLP